MGVCYNPNSTRSGACTKLSKVGSVPNFRGRVWVAAVCLVLFAAVSAAQKKKKEEITQTLQVPKDLPATIAGDPRHFAFYTTPLSGKGLLSAQIRDALKALSHEAGGASVLQIRA